MERVRGRACWVLILAAVSTAHAGAPESEWLTRLRATHAQVRDLSIQAERREFHDAELRRMERSSTGMLEFSHLKLYFMAPDRFRLEGRRGLAALRLVQNGNVQVVRLGLGIKSRRDLHGDVRRKENGLEIGLLPDDVWKDYQVVMVGTEILAGRPTELLQLRAHGERANLSFQKLWVDPDTCRVLRRDRFSGDGKLKSRVLFRTPYQTPVGTWLSRRIEVYNQNGKLVGALELTRIAVNRGLAESLFRI